MKYTHKISKAIKFSIKTHEVYQKQKRKGKDIPYITHPLTVGMILSLAGASEDVVIAGILHDTIEDSTDEKKVTKQMLSERFGENVAELVNSVSEVKKDSTAKERSWEERKAEALEHIKHFSNDSLMVKSADIISNGSELIDDYDKDGEDVFLRFNAPKEKIIQHSLQAITTILKQWKDNPLADDLQNVARGLQEIGLREFMVKHRAKVIDYSDYDENMSLECPICGWNGTPKESGWINTDSDFALDVSCPNCEKMLLVANYPSA